MRHSILAMLFSLIALPAFADMTLNDLSTGKTVLGPDVKLDEMKGKVVIVMYWGINCPPCKAEMPILAELYKKYEAQGLHIIGLECQNGTADVVKSIASGKGATYQITSGGSLKGANVSGIPHGFLFNAEGKLVDDKFRPHGSYENTIKDLLKDASGAMAGPGPYKKLAPIVAQMKAGMSGGQALKAATAKLKSSDAAEAAEAQQMVDALKASGNGQIERALSKKSEDPAAAVTILDKTALQYAGDEIGTKAKTESDALKKDPAVKKELDAEVMWKKIATMNDALKPVRGVKDPKDEAFKKQNMAAIQGIIGGCMALTKQFAGTKAATKADELMSEYK